MMSDEDYFENERDVGKLRAKVREVIGEKKKLQARLKEIESPKEPTPFEKFLADAPRRLIGLTGETRDAEIAKLNAEIEPILQAEVAARQAGHEGKLTLLRQDYARMRRAAEASSIATKLAKQGSASVLQPLLADRIGVEAKGEDDWEVIYRDANGLPVHIDELIQEFRNDPSLAPVIHASTAADKEVHAKRVAETLTLGTKKA